MIESKRNKKKQLVLRLDEDLYDTVYRMAKAKNITVLAAIRKLILNGIDFESKENEIYYLIKIVDMLKLNYDLAVQEFCNKGYAGNRDPKKDLAFREFLNNRVKDLMND